MKYAQDFIPDELAGIARYEVSEDGVEWRPYNPKEDGAKTLHKRIEFADADDGLGGQMAAQA